MFPSKVNKRNEKIILRDIYSNNIKLTGATDLKVGDAVRISDVSGPFRKGYLPAYSTAIYTIKKIRDTLPVQFILEDYEKKVSPKGFYR